MTISDDPQRSTVGTRAVGELLKFWPTKEAPLPLQIAFYEELQQVVQTYTKCEGRDGRWFGQLERELDRSLTTVRQLVTQLARELERARSQLDKAMNQVPSDLRRVLREAKR
jgi:chemotaxis protein histidine kinase CheA